MRQFIIGLILVHSWFDVFCCDNGDCKPIPCESVKHIEGGYLYDNFFFLDLMMKPSQDDKCYACIHEYENIKEPMCLYLHQKTIS